MYSAAAQPDGQIIAVGSFTSYNSVTRNNILRMDPGLHYPGGPAGILDSSFDPDITGVVVNVAIQDDEKILVSGAFSAVGSTSQAYLARLNTDGTLDTSFDPVFDNTVLATALQSDGKIIAYGFFTTVDGTSRNRIARLNTDGSLDTSFNANASGLIRTVHVQPDGQILLTGGSIVINGVSKAQAARLNPDGTLDTSFTLVGALGSYTGGAALMPNGKVIITSGAAEYGGYQYLRVNADGSADGTFTTYDFTQGMAIDPPLFVSTAVLTNGYVMFAGSIGTAFTSYVVSDNGSGPNNVGGGPTALYGVTPLADGATLVYGWNNSTPTDFSMERLDPVAFTDQITVTDSNTRIQWLRGGAAAEATSVSFQWSLTGNSDWTEQGAATRISGGWELTGLSIPTYGYIRARAAVLGGGYGVARSVIETRSVPVKGRLEVSHNGLLIPAYSPPPASVEQGTDFGSARMSIEPGVSSTFKIENVGAQTVTITYPMTSTYTPAVSPNHFSYSGLTTTILPGASHNFTLKFLPTVQGNITGAFSCNYTGGYSFSFPLKGVGVQSEIEVKGNGNNIADNSNTPLTSNHTHFGSVTVSADTSRTYTVNNLGNADLNISDVTLTGTHTADFTLSGITLPVVVPPSGSTTFTVTFDPTAIGEREAIINIANDDLTENPFNFRIGGTATPTWPTGTESLYTTSSISLSGPLPNLAIGFTPPVGTNLKVIDNTGTSFTTTTYSDLAQGQEITLPYNGAGFIFVADYYGGDGNDFVLHWKGTRPYAWGEGLNGRLGNGAATDQHSPYPVTYHGGVMVGKTIVQIASGTDHSLALDVDGKVYAWGLNTSYQLGDGTTTARTTPVQVSTTGLSALLGKTVVEIAAGDKFSLALCSDNTLVAWGENASGECGNSSVTTADRQIPTLVDVSAIGSRKVVGIATGPASSHSLLRCDDGTLYAWGINTSGCLGDGTTTTRRVPTAVNMTPFGSNTILSIATGLNFSIASAHTFYNYAWGENGYYQLGNQTTTDSSIPHVMQLYTSQGRNPAAGAYHALMTDTASNPYARAWGRNNYGQIGNGTTTSKTSPGSISGTQPTTKVSAGQNHSYALQSDGTLLAWGRNNLGLLGIDATTPTTSTTPVTVTTVNMTEGQRFVDIAAGLLHTQVLVASPQAVLSVEQPLANVLVDGSSTVDFDDVFLTTTHYKTFTIRNNGTGVLAGLYTTAPTGTHAANYTVSQPALTAIQPGETTTFIVGFKPTALGVRTAAFQIMGESLGTTLPIDIALTGTGTNTNMDLVLEIPTDLHTPLPADASVPVHAETFNANTKSLGLTLAHTPTPGQDITLMKLTGAPFMVGTFTGLDHAAQVNLSYGGQTYEYIVNYYGGSGNDLVLVWKHSRLFTWGYDGGFQGRLGQGTRPALADKTLPWPIIGSPLTGKTIFSVAQGSWHTVVLCSDGTLYAWGDNRSGQLGSGATYTPVNCSSVPVAVNMTGVLAGKTIVAIAAGSDHTLALDKDGIVYAWGQNYGALGDGTSTQRNSPVAVNRASGTALYNKKVCAIAAGQSHSLAICEDYILAAWGDNFYGQLGDNTTVDKLSPAAVIRTSASGSALYNKKAVAIGAGSNHSVALDIDGKAYAWGDNFYGQLGNGTTTDSLKPLAVNVASGSALEGKTLKSIPSGASHLFGITTDGDIIAWGSNSSGQLGDGTTTNRTLPVLIADDSNIQEICAGTRRSQFLYQDGSLFIIDANLYGETNTDPSAFAPGEYYAHLPVGAFAEHNSALVAGPVVGSPVVAIITPTGVEHLRIPGISLAPVASPAPLWRLSTGYSTPYTATIQNIGTADLTGISFGAWWGSNWTLDTTATSSSVAREGSTTFDLIPLYGTWSYDNYFFDSNLPRFIIPVSN